MIPDESMKLKRVSEQSSHTNGSYGDDDNYIPVALDPMPRPPGPPRSRSNEKRPPLNNETQGGSEERLRENFKDLVAGSASRSHSSERGPVSPHLANQILRQGSTDRAMNLRRRNESIKPSSPTSSYNTSPVDKKPMSPASGEGSDEQFRLQEAPRIRRRSSGSKRGSKVMNGSATAPNMTLAGQTEGSPVLTQETLVEPTPPPPVPNRKVSARQRSPLSNATSASSQEPPKSSERPERKESLNKPTAPGQAIPRKQVPRHGETMPAQLNTHPPERSQDPLSQHPNTAPATVGKTITSPQGNEAFEPPPRSSSRPAPTPGLSSAAMGNQVDSKHDFTSPREAPAPPPPSTRHKTTESVSSIQSEHFTARDGGTPIPHGASEVGPEDEFGRVEPDEDFDQGIFRKVSKAVRHGRSYSDKNNAGSPRFTKGSRNGSIDISSPMLPSGEGNEDNSLLRNKLRYSQQRIAELESEKNNLQEQVNGAVDIRQVNTELREKRSTMAFLDTQREMIIRELEIMTEQLTRAKEHDGPVDLDNIKHEALRDFANQMNKLKETLGSQIEQQIAQKTSLAADIDNLIQVKDKGAREAEALEHSVHQLQHLHNQLSGSIQHLYRNTATPSNGSVQAPSGLGIYNASMKDRQGSVTDERNNLDLRTALSMDNSIHSHLSGETEVEPATVLSAPRVVDMRKGQPKKFSWKKGSESMAKNVKKGFKGAFAATQSGSSNSALREDSFAESQPYGSIQAGDAPIMGDRPVGQRNGGGDAQRQTSQGGNWGLFGQKPSNAVRNALAASLPPETAVFGSDLSARCEYEKRVTPALITRCIDEVESRGMDVEGIYRKSGSYSQVKAVQQGFEKDPHGGPDLSDEEMDIHAITSALKQFLRKLPIPLITFEAYDFLIDGANEAGSSLDVTSSPIMIETCKHAIQVLPRSHKDTLEYLMGHLYRVMSREGENKVSQTCADDDSVRGSANRMALLSNISSLCDGEHKFFAHVRRCTLSLHGHCLRFRKVIANDDIYRWALPI